MIFRDKNHSILVQWTSTGLLLSSAFVVCYCIYNGRDNEVVRAIVKIINVTVWWT